MSAPVSITAWAHTSTVPSTWASFETTADGWMPGLAAGIGWNRAATLAQLAIGLAVVRGTVPGGTFDSISVSTGTAPARVCASAAA